MTESPSLSSGVRGGAHELRSGASVGCSAARVRAQSGEDLARMMLALMRLAVATRAHGWCVGALDPRDLVLVGDQFRLAELAPGIGSLVRRSDRVRRSFRHRAAGHESGCAELGIAMTALLACLRRWDSVGAAGLLAETVALVCAEVRAATIARGVWDQQDAIEAVVVRTAGVFPAANELPLFRE